MNKCNIFGLEVACELDLPGFAIGQSLDSTVIRFSYHALEQILEPRLFYRDGILQFDAAKFGRLIIKDRSTIEITPFSQLEIPHLVTFTLGSGLGSLLHVRQEIPLHGMAFLGKHGAVLMLGASGCGKSTLTAAMLQARIPVFTDDVIALTHQANGSIVINPAHRQIKLSAQITTELGLSQQNFATTAPTVNKLSWHAPPEYFYQTAMPVVAIGILAPNREQTSTAKIEKLSNINAMSMLLQNVYRRNLVKILGNQKVAFEQLHQLGLKVPIYQVTLPAMREGFDFTDYSVAISKQLTELPLI